MTNDEKAMHLAKEWHSKEAEILALLIAMWKTRELVALGFSGIWEYCVERLKFSPAQSYYFKNVAEKSEVVPELKQAVYKGKLSVSKARRIANVITPENKTEWIEKAETLSQKQLERAVTAVNPQAHIREKIRPIAPEVSELRTTVDRKTEENIKVLTDILSQKIGKAATLAEVIAFAAEFTREKTDPTRREKVSSGKRVAKKRDGNQCTYVARDGRRCTTQRHLHVHHVQHREHGGADTVDNLTTLCAAHHRQHHGAGSGIRPNPAQSSASSASAAAADSGTSAPAPRDRRLESSHDSE